MPIIFNYFVVESKHKYEIEKSMSYSCLSYEIFFFIYYLSTTIKPRNYSEALFDHNWI